MIKGTIVVGGEISEDLSGMGGSDRLSEGVVEEVVASVLEGMVVPFIGEEGTLEDWIEEASEMMVGKVEGAGGVVDMI